MEKVILNRISLAAGAVVVALTAILLGVYGNGGVTGNGGDARCQAARALTGHLAPLVTGEMAALLLADSPTDVSRLAFQDVRGAPKTIADFSGKAVLLNLWATWCAPCREEMPALDALQASRQGEDFEVVAVNVDVGAPEKPATFLKTAKIMNLADYRDPKMKIFNDLKVRGLAFGMPTTLLIDANGCQVAALHGPAKWDSAEALALIDRLARF